MTKYFLLGAAGLVLALSGCTSAAEKFNSIKELDSYQACINSGGKKFYAGIYGGRNILICEYGGGKK